MKHLKLIFLFLSLLSITSGCKEIIAKNIENDTPVLLVPSVNDTVQNNPVQFKWQALEGAEKYHLEVVSPSFSSISVYAIDTLVYGTEYLLALDSNEYEVKLTAINAGYKSKTLGPIKFWVGVSPQTSTNQVQLNSPVDSIFVNASFTGPFSWQSISNLLSFEFSLRKGSVFSSGAITDSQNNMQSVTVNLTSGITLTEGIYNWGVKAYLMNGSETPFAKRKIMVDTTIPNIPAGPFSPTAFANAGLVMFSWSNGVDNGIIKAPVNSILQISKDPGFATILHSATVLGSTASVNMTMDSIATTYYWNVINTDEAGNSSNYSATNQFILNQ